MTHSTNFLEQHDQSTPHHHPHHHWRKRVSRRLVFGLVVVFALYLVVAALGAGRVIASSLDAKDAMTRAEVAARDLNFPGATSELDSAQLAIARAQTGLVVLAPLRFVPLLGDQVRAVGDVLSASARVVPSLQDAVTIAAEVVGVIDRANALSDENSNQQWTYLTMPDSTRRDLLEKLHQAEPQLILMRTRLALAEEDLASLDGLTLIGPVRQAVAPFAELIPVLKEAVDFFIPVAEIIPEFGGLEEPKQYLVLFENNTELRPGGGFVGNYVGSMTVADGLVGDIVTEDSYAIDGQVEGLVTTPPPDPLRKYLGVDAWYFRDANWSPDFALSARQSLALFADEERLLGRSPTPYDGVIALTPTFAADLLNLVGPVTIDGQTFTSENIADTLEYQVEFGYAAQGLPASQRKEIVQTLSIEVMDRLFRLPINVWVSVTDVALQALKEKQLLVYSSNEQTQKALVEAGWAGAIAPEEGKDFLMIVDANLASLKSDPAVSRSIVYELKHDDQGNLLADVAVTYTHQGTFDWKTTRYRTYTRIFAPLGSTLVSAEGMLENDKLLNPSQKAGVIDVGDASGFTTFGAFLSVEPGESRTLHMTYVLPETLKEAVSQGAYKLQVSKQPGAQNNALTVTANFGKPLVSATPAEDPSAFGDQVYVVETVLDQNQEFVIRF